jgi:acyl carrier protein
MRYNNMNSELSTTIHSFILENFLFGDSGNGIKDTDSFLENGIIDSTGVLELVSFLEEKFSIEVADEELIPENLDSIANVVNYLQKKINREGEKQEERFA